MVKVTILGAGVTGMTIASQLPVDYEVTIVGKHLPGDLDKNWASPWAGAVWVGVHNSNKEDQRTQLDGFTGLWHLAEKHPDSSVHTAEMTEIMDIGSPDDVWYQGKLPDFRFLSEDELPVGAKYGMKYKTLVITPQVFVVWMRQRLEAHSIKFLRANVLALGDLKNLGHDILINASGLGSATLNDVRDPHLIPYRNQSLVIRDSNYQGLYIRRGPDGYYSTAFARQDGNVYMGGMLTANSTDITAKEEIRNRIISRVHDNLPQYFPSPKITYYDFVGDHVGYWPSRLTEHGGNRVEKEVLDGQKVIHAYGQFAGGYVNSYGVALKVRRLVEEFLYPQARL